MVKKLGSGGFASVFLLSNQVPLFLLQTFNSNLQNIKTFRIPDLTFCLQRQTVGSMQPNTKRRAITRKNGALGQRWPCSVGWNPAGGNIQTFAVSDLFLFLVLVIVVFFLSLCLTCSVEWNPAGGNMQTFAVSVFVSELSLVLVIVVAFLSLC